MGKSLFSRIRFYLFYIFLCSFFFSCATTEIQNLDPADPWESSNRSVHEFNDTLDRWFLKPTAKAYNFVTPNFLQTGISNVFSNIGSIGSAVNNLLQGKLLGFSSELSRVVINSTIGIYGVFDVASSLGINAKSEDMGQTLGYWGVGSGPYMVVPFYGPTTVRDFSSIVPEIYITPSIPDDYSARLAAASLNVVNIRSSLLSVSDLSGNDQYSFYRDAYLQRREYVISDGKLDESLFEDEFD
jgi:phospholipid-binding lipoprotein MlaA|tara:strand:+ start:929 stop:1654 length:726 start_codon:yes stop_codon:yes gene_type:complete